MTDDLHAQARSETSKDSVRNPWLTKSSVSPFFRRFANAYVSSGVALASGLRPSIAQWCSPRASMAYSSRFQVPGGSPAVIHCQWPPRFLDVMDVTGKPESYHMQGWASL